ncbi:MAG TPA: hypothetical protein PLK90_06255 [Clostridiales bacterium]|nr:hypothetical protein [Clostridiales bacterium]HQP69985.1 hypothetical protein [Clostridiales bacterium]
MIKLFILTNSAGAIPQKILETESISVEVISSYFKSKSAEVIVLTYDQFITKYGEFRNEIRDSFFIYASSQHPTYYSAIEDVLLFIERSGGILIPDFIHFRAHENKYLQEMIKAELNISTPGSYLISSIEEGHSKILNLKFPIVAKLASGFGSNFVKLLKNEKEAEKYLADNLTAVIKTRKNFIKYRNKVNEYRNKHPLKVGKIIFQDFIDEIENDWKILIFGNRLFYLKRYFKENDFRASGSGNFDNKTAPDKKLLEFAMSVKIKLNTPWVSLDIIQKNDLLYLIEYQCVHFGLYTAMKSIKHFEYINGKFEEFNGQTDIDRIFAEELYSFITGYNI